MSEQRFTFKPSELRHISIECKQCRTRITFDMTEAARAVEHCPACHAHLPNLNRLLNDFREFQSNADTEYFVVRVETESVTSG